MTLDKYFAFVTLDQLAGLKRTAGYPEAMRRLDELRWKLLARYPSAEHPRVSRHGVEFIFQATDRAAAELFLSELTGGLADPSLIDSERLPGRIAAAAVAFRGGLSDDVIAAGNAALTRVLGKRRSVFVAGDQPAAGDNELLIEDLHAALRDGGLALHYQPKIHCRSCELAGVEALIRWTHPLRGPVSPELFIPLAEQSGTIRAITSWVIQQAVSDQVRLRSEGLDLLININISTPLIADPAFVDQMISEFGGGTSAIGLEITETAMMAHPEGTLANLHRLSTAGIHLAIDDYGSGFSSLAYLQQLPIHELKIDKTFISRLSQGSRDPLLVRSTIDLAHALEMEVTAEGVESAAAFALLQVMRCDLVQGYFLSPALPIHDLLAFARRADPVSEFAKPASLRERLARRRSEQGTAA